MWGGLRLNLQTNSIITAVMSKRTSQPVFLSLYLSVEWPFCLSYSPVWPHYLSSLLSVWPSCHPLAGCFIVLVHLYTCLTSLSVCVKFTCLPVSVRRCHSACLTYLAAFAPFHHSLYLLVSTHGDLFLYLSVCPACVCVWEREREIDRPGNYQVTQGLGTGSEKHGLTLLPW